MLINAFFSGSVFSLMNSALGLGETSLTMLTDDPVAMLVPLPNEGQAHHMFSRFLNLQIYYFFPRNFPLFVFVYLYFYKGPSLYYVIKRTGWVGLENGQFC